MNVLEEDTNTEDYYKPKSFISIIVQYIWQLFAA